MIFKKLCCALLAAAFCVLPCQTQANTPSTKRIDWFFKSNPGARPELLGGSALVEQYNILALGPETEKVLYLTFDAGYENGNVAKILDALQKHDAKGAFFILPGLCKHSPELVRRMADEGHTVCNHSTSHKNMASVTDATRFQAELRGIEDAYRETTGKELSKFFRPPEGAFSEQTLQFCKENGYHVVLWSFAYADWDNKNQPDPASAKKKILDNLHPGEVLLLHPTSETNAAILDELLTEIERRGYRFGTLDELVAEPTVKNVFSGNPNAEKMLALTFDDGPHPTQTDEILAVLEEYGVKATFFPIGENIQNHPDVMRRVYESGHEIGNHTYSHGMVSKMSSETLKNEIKKTEALLQTAVGVTPKWFRPPGGDVSDQAIELVREMGYNYVLWSWKVDTRDWASPPVERVVDTVLNNVKSGDVVLFHDFVSGKSPTAEALRTVLPILIGRGYTFVTLSTLASQ